MEVEETLEVVESENPLLTTPVEEVVGEQTLPEVAEAAE